MAKTGPGEYTTCFMVNDPNPKIEPLSNVLTLRAQMHEVIFEADTPAGKVFDVLLLWTILCSVAVVVLESVFENRLQYGKLFLILEWGFTLIFTVEYVLRLFCVTKPVKYARSFFGVVDLLAIMPTYMSLFVEGTQSLMVIRALRLLRIFRVLKLATYLGEANFLLSALREARRKIIVFLGALAVMVVIVASLMYLIEGTEGGFVDIPTAIYWCVVTITTVGYGDIVPQTILGRTLAALLMIMGYAIIAVPTGIVSSELSKKAIKGISTQACLACSSEGHDTDAIYCKKCGAAL